MARKKNRYMATCLIYQSMLKDLCHLLSDRACSSFLILVIAFTGMGCGHLLGQDAAVVDENEQTAAQVKVILAQEPDLDAAPIDIKVDSGVVTLGGFVEKESQRKKVTKAVESVTGVHSVINNIQIK